MSAKQKAEKKNRKFQPKLKKQLSFKKNKKQWLTVNHQNYGNARLYGDYNSMATNHTKGVSNNNRPSPIQTNQQTPAKQYQQQNSGYTTPTNQQQQHQQQQQQQQHKSNHSRGNSSPPPIVSRHRSGSTCSSTSTNSNNSSFYIPYNVEKEEEEHFQRRLSGFKQQYHPFYNQNINGYTCLTFLFFCLCLFVCLYVCMCVFFVF